MCTISDSILLCVFRIYKFSYSLRLCLRPHALCAGDGGTGEDIAKCGGAGEAVGQGTGRGGIGGTPGTIKALVAVMVVCDWAAAR